MTGRGTETEDVIRKRLRRAAEEAVEAEKYDYIIVNDDVDECAQRLNSLIRSQRLRTNSNLAFMRALQKDLTKLTQEGE